ncbi:UDP-glucuronosyl/UDP-glucosyltransferase [Parasponia andersonii]|uniref:Glycosyltransferase n=1 Tax=Parasponia andersonii TaxID=3476 RepID=A0A2P5A5S9_PARAD|nr:UDP-glucuronosyl/UDP-glucosyltransferase [Parasponia andersonii]
MATSQDHSPKQSSSLSSSSPVLVVIVPFPAQSHLNQLLQLSHVVSSYDIPVHYVATALHNSQVKSRASNALHHLTKVQFHDLQTPHFLSPQPSKTPSNFPSHLMPAFEACVHLRRPFSDLLTKLSTTAKRVVVIHDSLMSFVVQDSASLVPNSEAYLFHCISAISKFSSLRDAMEGGDSGVDHDNQPKIPSLIESIDPRFEAFLADQIPLLKVNKSGHLYNTCRLIESDFLDFILEKERENDDNTKLWAIGPLETVTIFKKRPLDSINDDSERDYNLEWLKKQRPNSVLYVSFGTTTFLEDKQIEEIAIGLEKSEVNFIWVLRDADKGDIFDEESVRRPQLPKGFEERVKGMGMVVREWVPQLEILGHPSTGGFMSHCGWNSCLESMSLGVPIVAWPMHSDQPMNAVLITEFLKVGLAVREWGKGEDLVKSSVIEKVVKRLMASNEGDEIRKRAEELGGELRKATAEGGVSRKELDSLISHITR